MITELTNIVIIGAGFGGLRVVRNLRNAPLKVTLIDKNNYHLFQPLLYQVATAGIAPEEIAYPVRGILRNQSNLEFRMAEVNHIDYEHHKVITTTDEIPYDYLVIAIGGETNFFELKSVSQHSLGLKNLDDAIIIRNHILRKFEQAVHESDPNLKRALLTFVVVGGGPTGVESAGALAELIRLVLIKDYPSINIKDVRVLLLEALDQLLPSFSEQLREFALKVLWGKHVEVRFGASVADFDGKRIELKGGELIPAHTLLWTAGVRIACLANKIGFQQSRQGRIIVGQTLQVPGHPEIYVIGDAAYLEDSKGNPLPMVATVALQQAALTARNIIAAIRNEAQKEFVFEDPGALATIGRSSAVARVGRFEFSGFLAWLMWSVVHVFQLIGFRNRLMVLINWGWDYFLYDRAVRLISPSKDC